MNLETLRKTWHDLGTEDPLWAILTHEERRGGGWDLDAFLQTGEDEIAELFARLASLAPGASPRRALDFGCGVGRLSFALARRVEEVHGVDIARSMIENARAHETRLTGSIQPPRAAGRCVFHHNVHPHLERFDDGTFDLIYSNITLQHMPPRLQSRYLVEFCRVLAPDGLLVFQLPEAPRRPLNVLGHVTRTCSVFWQRHVRRRPVMEMHAQPRPRVVSTLEEHGCRVLEAEQDEWSGPDWLSVRYVARKSGSRPS